MNDLSNNSQAGKAFVHKTAVVDEPCEIGDGTRIWHFCHLMKGCRIGRDCVLGQNAFVASGVEIGNNVKVQNNVSIYQGVTLEDDVFVGPSAVFTNISTPRAHVSRKHAFEQTRVGRGATIGANATVICGHTVGAFAFVGAGAVVTRNVRPHSLVLGNPAEHVGWMCQCGVRLNTSLTCAECRRVYTLARGELREKRAYG